MANLEQIETRDDSNDTSAASASPSNRVDANGATAPTEAPPIPIKLLETLITFYKAPTTKEDPAAAAVDATSFCDDHNLEGVVVFEKDPSSATIAASLERVRLHGLDEAQQGRLQYAVLHLGRQQAMHVVQLRACLRSVLCCRRVVSSFPCLQVA